MIARSRRHRVTLAVLVVVLAEGSSLAARPPKRAPPGTGSTPIPASGAPSAPDADSPRESVQVTVVEVAGTQAYLTPGASKGVRRGAMVALGRKEYQVVQATDSFAAIVVGDDAPREGEKGAAAPLTEETNRVVKLSKPKELATWTGAWPEPSPPARSQHPRFVALGDEKRDSRWDIRLTASGGGLLPLGARGSNLARAELEARIHAQPFAAPATLDADAAIERWFDARLADREGSSGRPLLFVRELFAGYGASGYGGGIGRMRYAASTLGVLDGARARAPIGSGFSVGAFGGLLPHPLSGAPSTSGNRFGVEATYSRPDAPLRPDAALVVHGSTFGGRVDERRISGVASLYPGPSRLGAYFELSGFDRSNPWKASPFELTAAGLDSSVRLGRFRFEGRVDLRRPERSRWLAAYLPSAWFCTTLPAIGTPPAPEPCSGRVSTAAYGTVDAVLELDRLSISAGVTAVGELTQPGSPTTTSAFGAGRLVGIANAIRFDASGNYSNGTYLTGGGGTFGPGVVLLEESLDLSAYYRIGVLSYRSTPASFVQHGAGGAITYLPDATLLFAFQGEAVTGDDVQALVLFGTVTWHPRL
jgi:hypothetical protein